MRDLVKTTQDREISSNGGFVSALGLHILTAVLGFISARAVIFETLMPFGLVFVGGCNTVFLPGVAVGAFIGYFIPATGSGGFRYMSALLAIIALRLLLSNYKKLSENPIFLSVITLIANLSTGIISYSGITLDLLKLSSESIIILGGVFVVRRAFTAVLHKKAGFSVEELACMLGSATIIIIGISKFYILGISVGRTFAVFLILIATKYGGTSVGSICGIAMTFASAVTRSFEGGFGIYAVLGLAAGVFGSLSKYAQALSAIASGIIGLAFMEFKVGSGVFLTEIFIAALFFILIPRSFGIGVSKIFYRQPLLRRDSALGRALNMRLNLASNALLDVSSTVAQVSEELGKINAPDFKNVISHIEQDACAGCKLRMHCWESKNASTIESIMCMINIIKGADTSQNEQALSEFRGMCLRVKKMEDTVKNRYSQYASLIAAENRIEEVRQVVSEQFEGISNMLSELAMDFYNEEQFDLHAAEAVTQALNDLGIHTLEATAKIDKFGRMSIESKIKLNDDLILNRLQIMKMLSLACERDFDVPNISKTGDTAIITVNEHAKLRVDMGIEQSCAVAGSICGDSYKFFNDGKGHFVMVLSDGMGTGGRAAVDGAMASGLMSRLIKAGFGYNCSLKILNSSMLFKSSDESLATMDIASIDLFTGNTELYKAGAAPTLVRRSGRSGRAESHSLPIGILNDVSFDRAGIKLRQGDILLLISDGVTFDGTEWIRNELEQWRDGSAQDLAEHICGCARRRCIIGRPDDITVMAAIIEKSA
ncbi:MAG: SpoIIE family protein phosphatase [Clostridia bacterium]|nr:SpoIIE family protein phosphatase [Clostridia bacterium]